MQKLVQFKRSLCALALLTLPMGFLVAEPNVAMKVDLYIDREPTKEEINQNFTGAKFEPKVGCYVGAFLDLDQTQEEVYQDQVGKIRRLPEPFEQKVGKKHATYFYYMGYGSRFATDWVQKLGSDNRIVHIALEPNNGLEAVKEDLYLIELAKSMASTNTKIFLRFASEMNGPWVKYHGDSKLYKEKFQLVSKVMKEFAPNVAMVWCTYATPTRPIKNYYPGDKYVDWVGVNLYSVTYHDQDPNKPAKHINPVDHLDYIYKNYADKKPIMIGEFGATHFSSLENKSVSDFARKNIMSLYLALPRAYPRVKCINYFNANNLILSHRKNNNYAVTQDPDVLQTYSTAINEDYYLSQSVNEAGNVASDFQVVPVSGNPQDYPNQTPPRPFKARKTEYVSGPVMFSAWMKDHRSDIAMRFMVDGRTFWLGKSREDWRVELDTRKLENGPHEITLVARSNNKTIDEKTTTIVVNNSQ